MPQVKKGHYNEEKYLNIERILSYGHQIRLVNSLKPENVLEIGVGNGFVGNFLKQLKYDVTTLDFDKSLDPDIICDIREIPRKDNSFDAVCAFEVLEHLPYIESMKALKEMRRVSRRYVVISLPYSCAYINLSFFFGLPIFRKLFSLGLRIPFFFLPGSYGNKQHYWELGRRGYPKSRIAKDINKMGFKILKKEHIDLNTQHYFYVLEK